MTFRSPAREGFAPVATASDWKRWLCFASAGLLCGSVPVQGWAQAGARPLPAAQPTARVSVPPLSLKLNVPAIREVVPERMIKVREFRVVGAQMIPSRDLLEEVADARGKLFDFAGLEALAARLRRFYAARGIPLADVYLPPQEFPSDAAVVEFRVVEPRIGRVQVRYAPNVPVDSAKVEAMVRAHLIPGHGITNELLDRTALLLRDIPGMSASVVVNPGVQPGRADLVVQVAPSGSRVQGAVTLDNYGNASTGRLRLTMAVQASNLLRQGDVASASFTKAFQASEGSDTRLYRLSYRHPIFDAGTSITATVARSQYQVGGPFAVLGVSGDATVGAVTVAHPLVRSRSSNLSIQAGLEAKSLKDAVATLQPQRKVILGRAGITGTIPDEGFFQGAVTQFSVLTAVGTLQIDDALTRQEDQRVTGPQTVGSFGKANLELSRTEYLTARTRLTTSLSAQWASRNLTSAEKLSLTGPIGVRGYPIGTQTVVDEGAVASLELRSTLPWEWRGIRVNGSVFLDGGSGLLNKRVDPGVNLALVGAPNRVNVGSGGLGLLIGEEGNFLGSAGVSWRAANNPLGIDGDKAQWWASVQKQF